MRCQEFELVVVDSASRGSAVREVASSAGAVVLRCEQPGLARARNAGVAGSTSPYIAFTEDDFLSIGSLLSGAFLTTQLLAVQPIGIVDGRTVYVSASGAIMDRKAFSCSSLKPPGCFVVQLEA